MGIDDLNGQIFMSRVRVGDPWTVGLMDKSPTTKT